MITRSKCGVWMYNEDRFESVARMVAIDCMVGMGMDQSDFKTRDKIISAISPRISATLDEVAGVDEPLQPECSAEDSDGVPSEMAVLRRFWIEHHSKVS